MINIKFPAYIGPLLSVKSESSEDIVFFLVDNKTSVFDVVTEVPTTYEDRLKLVREICNCTEERPYFGDVPMVRVDSMYELVEEEKRLLKASALGVICYSAYSFDTEPTIIKFQRRSRDE